MWSAASGERRSTRRNASRPISFTRQPAASAQTTLALRGALVRGADPTPATATAASLINTTDDGAVDVLVRLEANAAARAFRVTVRSPSPAAAAAFKNVLQALLTSYFAV